MSRRLAFVLVVLAACGGKIDLNAEPTRTRQVGTVTSSSGGGASSSSPPNGGADISCYASALIPFEADFEGGAIGDDFTVNSPSAFSIEWDEPISGSASLRVKPSASSYLARRVKGVCAARLQFTLRASADFVKGGGHLARIDAGSRRFSIVMSPGGSLGVEEAITGTNASGGAGGAPIGDILADDPTLITLDVDLSAEKLTYGFSSSHGAAPTVVVSMIQAEPASPPAITSIELGSTPGSWSPQGLYWLDDIEIQ